MYLSFFYLMLHIGHSIIVIEIKMPALCLRSEH